MVMIKREVLSNIKQGNVSGDKKNSIWSCKGLGFTDQCHLTSNAGEDTFLILDKIRPFALSTIANRKLNYEPIAQRHAMPRSAPSHHERQPHPSLR